MTDEEKHALCESLLYLSWWFPEDELWSEEPSPFDVLEVTVLPRRA